MLHRKLLENTKRLHANRKKDIVEINQILGILKHQGLEFEDSIELKTFIEDEVNKNLKENMDEKK